LVIKKLYANMRRQTDFLGQKTTARGRRNMRRWKTVGLLLVMAWGLLVPGSVWGAAGGQLWETPFTFLPQYDTITINCTALSATTYILTGNARNGDGTGGQEGFIKAFDVATGHIKWEKSLTLGANGNSFGGVVINGDIALVRGGYGTGVPPTVLKNFIRAYHADSGQLLWEVLRDFESSATPNSVGLPITLTANNQVFTFFSTIKADGTPDFSTIFARAYQVRNIPLQPLLLLD
jgi:outer membrane protein assembly factor BamB